MVRSIYVEKHVLRIVATRILRYAWPGALFSPISPLRSGEFKQGALPGPRWIRVSNRQCGICGTDLTLACVDVNPTITLAALPGNKRIYLGHEIVGTVVETGDAVEAVSVGDRVIMDTRFQGQTCLSQDLSEHCRHCRNGNFMLCERVGVEPSAVGVGGGWSDEFTCHETEVYRVPDDLSDDEAMFIEPLSTGVRAVLRAQPRSGQSALVYGAGVVGLNVLQSLRALVPDCSATVVARHAHQAQMAGRLGAKEVFVKNPLHDEVARITGARVFRGPFGAVTLVGGFDVVFDCVGSATSLTTSLRWARAGGTVVMVGIDMNPVRVDLSPVWHQEVKLVGVLAHGREYLGSGDTRHTYDVVTEHLRSGALMAKALITHRFPLSNWRGALEAALDKRRSGALKVVIDID